MALQVQMISIDALKPCKNNARTHSKKQIAQIGRSIRELGFNNPVLVDKSNTIICGHGRVSAAKDQGMAEVPTICLDHLSETEIRAYMLADNKLAEKAGWDEEILRIEFQNFLAMDLNFDLTQTGFDTPEIDLIIHGNLGVKEDDPLDKVPDESLVLKMVNSGDLWQLGNHRLYCGDSLKSESFNILLDGKKADIVFTDPPYNVTVDGHVGGKGSIKHTEFAYASGEMTEQQFTEFLRTSFGLMTAYSALCSIHYICMDWRHIAEITAAGKSAYSELKNICVWNKQLGGMGSLYRSQHELVFVFKSGNAPHINNIELGKHGRYRTNVWDYPGVHVSNAHRDDLKFHPTCKPVQMIADAIIDCSKQGALVLDCFAGSGSTLLAAEKVKRKAYVIEYEPKYCDVILYRFEKMTGIKPELICGGPHV